MIVSVLQGIRVLDFGQTWAGPAVGAALADMGAEVIKVESSRHLDTMRRSPDNEEQDIEKDPFFQSLNRSKLSITVDFTVEAGVAILKRLVALSDVVIENFSPGVMLRRGLDYECLCAIKPDIIMITLPGVGSVGPAADMMTYGNSIGALAGFDAMVGYSGDRVLGLQVPYADASSGIHGALAVLAALYHRNKTGQGQLVEVAQLEAAIGMVGEAVMECSITGRVPGTRGNFHPAMFPYDNYPCLGDDKWVSIAIATEDEWRALCEVIGKPEWAAREEFAGNRRRERAGEVHAAIAHWTSRHTHYEAMRILQAVGVAAMPCLDMGERLTDPHLTERQMYLQLEHPRIGIGFVPNVVQRLSETPAVISRPAPLLGEHNGYVFGELLGMSRDAIAQLIRDEVII